VSNDFYLAVRRKVNKIDSSSPTNTQMEQDYCKSTGIPNAILPPCPHTPNLIR
jgi:hypothetical protein